MVIIARDESANLVNKEELTDQLNLLQAPSNDNDGDSTPFVDNVDSGAIFNSQTHQDESKSDSNKTSVARIPVSHLHHLLPTPNLKRIIMIVLDQ